MCLVCNPNMIVQRLRLKPGMRLLEIGSGAGRILLPAARQIGPTGAARGVDFQAGMIRLCQKQAQRAQLRVELNHGDFHHMVWEPETFDRCVCVTVLGEIPQRQSVLYGIERLLKPGGICSVTEVLPDPCFQTRRAVTKMATAAGLVPLESFRGLFAYTLNFEKPVDA